MTPVLLAAKFGDESIEIFQKLVEKGADLAAKDANDNSILHIIAMSQAKQIFLFLKEKIGFEFNFLERNKNGDTPISIADKSSNKHFKEFLHKQAGSQVKPHIEDKTL